MQTVSEKILLTPEKKAPRPKFKTFWRYVFTSWKFALTFCVALVFFLWVKYWALTTSAQTQAVPWVRVIGLELTATMILLFVFGALFASHRQVYGPRKDAFITRNKREIKK